MDNYQVINKWRQLAWPMSVVSVCILYVCELCVRAAAVPVFFLQLERRQGLEGT